MLRGVRRRKGSLRLIENAENPSKLDMLKTLRRGSPLPPIGLTKSSGEIMSKCNRGKPCGNSCISDSLKCRKSLEKSHSKAVAEASRRILGEFDRDVALAEMALDMFRDAAAMRPSAGGEKEFEKIVKEFEKLFKGPIRKPLQIKALEQGLRNKGLLPPLLGEPSPTKPGELSRSSKRQVDMAKDFDTALDLKNTRREGNTRYNGWDGSYDYGMSLAGQGSYSTVIRNPDGTFVKRGTISNEEASLLQILSRADLGPRVIAADINGKDPRESLDFVDLRIGRIAMTEVKGETLIPSGIKAGVKRIPPDEKVSGKNAADVYWESMAAIHRLGIAHNDAHPMNIIVDDSGKGRWVDLGLSQKSPKAALAEVMGVFINIPPVPSLGKSSRGPESGNWQTLSWDITGASLAERVYRGLESSPGEFSERFPTLSKVFEKWRYGGLQGKLKKMGLKQAEIFEMCFQGIRATPESFTRGGWGKLTDEQALEVINFIYEGI